VLEPYWLRVSYAEDLAVLVEKAVAVVVVVVVGRVDLLVVRVQERASAQSPLTGPFL
jgi:hypothetical protein